MSDNDEDIIGVFENLKIEDDYYNEVQQAIQADNIPRPLQPIPAHNPGRVESVHDWEGYFEVYPSVYRIGDATQLSGDKVVFPAGVLAQLTNLNAKFPLLFTATNQTSFIEKTSACRAYEFGAQEGQIYMSESMMDNLLLAEGSLVQVKYAELPKATFVKLRPMKGNEYMRYWSNHKAVLEFALRDYATLSLDDTIVVKYEEQEFYFVVTDLQPSRMVCILNTDVEVEFEEEESNIVASHIAKICESLQETKKEEPEEEEITQIPANNVNLGVGRTLNGGISISNTKQSSNHAQKPTSIGNSNNSNGFLVGNKSQQQKDKENVDDEDMNRMAKRTGRRKRGEAVEEAPVEVKQSFVSFSGHGNRIGSQKDATLPTSTTTNTITASTLTNNLNSNNNSNNNNNNSVNNSVNGGNNVPASTDGGIICNNCLKSVPAATMMMHEAFCLRNNYRCEICGMVMTKQEREKHHEVNHAIVECPDCHMEMESAKLPTHFENQCAKRKIRCQFCELAFTDEQMVEHISFCGARTEQCSNCQRYIMLQDLETHLITNCEYPIVNEPVATPSSVVGPDDDSATDGYASLYDYNAGPRSGINNNISAEYTQYANNYEQNVERYGSTSRQESCPHCNLQFDKPLLQKHTKTMAETLINTILLGNRDNFTDEIMLHVPIMQTYFTNGIDLLKFGEAIVKTTFEMLSFLLELGIVDQLYHPELAENQTLLHVAGKCANIINTELLLQYKLDDLQKVDNMKENPLHKAAQGGNRDAAMLFIMAGVDKDAVNEFNDSPLSLAVKHSSIDVIGQLIVQGCSLVGCSFTQKQWPKLCTILSKLVETHCVKGEHTEESKTVVEQIGSLFSSSQSPRLLLKLRKKIENVCEDFPALISSTDPSVLSIIDDNTISFVVTNFGTAPCHFNYILPSIEGVSFSIITPEKQFILAPNVSCTVNLEIDIKENVTRPARCCVILEANSTENSNKGVFYHFVGINLPPQKK